MVFFPIPFLSWSFIKLSNHLCILTLLVLWSSTDITSVRVNWGSSLRLSFNFRSSESNSFELFGSLSYSHIEPMVIDNKIINYYIGDHSVSLMELEMGWSGIPSSPSWVLRQ